MSKPLKNRRIARGSSSVNLNGYFPHIYLRNIQDTNETLFITCCAAMPEKMPVIYTPTVGEACEHFSEIYRRARSVYFLA
jgi:malic enzyme